MVRKDELESFRYATQHQHSINFLAAYVLGPVLLVLLYPRVKRWGLIWTDIMDKADVSPGMNRALGSILMGEES